MQEELRLHKKDGRERLNIAITHSSTRNFLSHTLTPQCQKRRNEKKAREREEREREKWIRRRELKREGTRALCFILIYIISALSKHRLIHKHGHQYSQRPERQPRCDLLHHIEQSVQMIIHTGNQPRRSSVLTHASFSFHRDIHISVHLFVHIDIIITIRILHCLSVCACRMHRRKEKQGSSILTTTWSRNRNV